MKEKFEKEILTLEILKKDVRGILVYNIFANFYFGALFLLLVFAFYNLFLFSDISRQSLNVIFSIIAVIVFAPFLFVVIRYIRMLIMLKKGCYDITTDKVCDKKRNKWFTPRYRIYSKRQILSFGLFKTDYIFCFEKHKKFYLSSGGHYSFSQNNQIQYYRQFESTEICDEFYLFVIDNKIIEIYSTKVFEFQE